MVLLGAFDRALIQDTVAPLSRNAYLCSEAAPSAKTQTNVSIQTQMFFYGFSCNTVVPAPYPVIILAFTELYL